MLKDVVVAVDSLHVARVMTSAGCLPIVCDDGPRALNLLEDNPDSQRIITDVSTPGTDSGASPVPVLLDGGSA